MISRRDFLGSIACALATAGVASRIPRAAIVEPLTVKPPKILRAWVEFDGMTVFEPLTLVEWRVLYGQDHNPDDMRLVT